MAIPKCPVCWENYTVSGSNVPYNLPCGHCICHACLQNYNLQTCPSCRELINKYRCSKSYGVISALIEEQESPIPAARRIGGLSCCSCSTQLPNSNARICETCTPIEGDYEQGGFSSVLLCSDCILEEHQGHVIKKLAEFRNKSHAAKMRNQMETIFTKLPYELWEFYEKTNTKKEILQKEIENALKYLEQCSEEGDGERIRKQLSEQYKSLEYRIGQLSSAQQELDTEITAAISALTVYPKVEVPPVAPTRRNRRK